MQKFIGEIKKSNSHSSRERLWNNVAKKPYGSNAGRKFCALKIQ